MSALTAAPLAGRRWRAPRSGLLVTLCLAFLAALVVAVVAGPWLAPADPAHQDLLATATGPGAGHPLGTDELGRDILSRVLVGARTAVLGPLVVALGTMVFGTALGLLAGYRGGAVETVVLRACELMYALPGVLVAIVVVGVLGGGLTMAILVLVVLSTPWDVRLVHSVVLQQRQLPYVEAARTLGLSARRVMGV